LLLQAGNSGDISYLLTSAMVIHDVILMSLSLYLFTVPVNLVCIKLWDLAEKNLHDSAGNSLWDFFNDTTL